MPKLRAAKNKGFNSTPNQIPGYDPGSTGHKKGLEPVFRRLAPAVDACPVILCMTRAVTCVCVCDAVVNHIGVRAIGGHYIVDVFHPGYNCWVRCDDNNVFSLPTANVTKFASSKVPYLIFYRRLEPS